MIHEDSEFIIHRLEIFNWVRQIRVFNNIVIAVNISKLHWVKIICYKGDDMYLDSRGGSTCQLFKKSMDAMMYLEINWIFILYYPQQKNELICGIFVIWFVHDIVESLGLFRKNLS